MHRKTHEYKLTTTQIEDGKWRATYTNADGNTVAEGEGGSPELAAHNAARLMSLELTRVIAKEMSASGGGTLLLGVGAGVADESV